MSTENKPLLQLAQLVIYTKIVAYQKNHCQKVTKSLEILSRHSEQ
jgi:hypothetical protein